MDDRKRAEYLGVIRDRLGIDTDKVRKPLITLPQIGQLAGVASGTPGQWRQRSIAGSMRVPMPDPVPIGEGSTKDQPQWDALKVCAWLDDPAQSDRQRRWPPGSAARMQTRGKRGPRAKRTQPRQDEVSPDGAVPHSDTAQAAA